MNTLISYLQDALVEYKRNNFQKALFLLEQAEAEFPNRNGNSAYFEDLYLLKGSIYYTVEDYDMALASFENALKTNPQSSQACHNIAKVFYIQDAPDKAEVMLEWALKLDPTNESAEKLLSLVQQALKEQEQSGPGEESQLLVTAFELFSKKEFDKAYEELSKIKNIYEENLAGVLNFMGFCQLGMNQLANAAAVFERALSLNPESSQALAGIGEVYYLNNDDTRALHYYTRAVTLNPSNEFARAGYKKLTGREYDVPAESRNINLQQMLEEALKLYTEKQYKDSLRLLEECTLLIENPSPQEAEIISRMENFKGFNYLGLREIENARKCFENALINFPESSQACAGLGEVFYLQGRKAESKTMFEWSVKHNKENLFALNGLKRVNLELGLDPNDYTLN